MEEHTCLQSDVMQVAIRSAGSPTRRTPINFGWFAGSIKVKDLRVAIHLLAEAFPKGGTKTAKEIAGKVLGINPRRIVEMMAMEDNRVLRFDPERAKIFCEVFDSWAVRDSLKYFKDSEARDRKSVV